MPTHRRFSLTTTPSSTVLQRIVSVCARRQCRVTQLAWRLGDQNGALDITLCGQAQVMGTMCLRLAALIDVLAVSEAPSTTDATPAKPARDHGTT